MTNRVQVTRSDDELIRACVRGDQLAWNALVDRYAALIYSIPLKYGFSETDAADVFQSVCVTLLEKLGTVRAPAGLAAWIITTTSRQCIAASRQRRRELSRTISHGALPDRPEPIDPEQLPEDELLALERQHLVRTAVDQLPANCQRLIGALFSDAVEPTSYRQLADGLGVPMNSLGPTRARCLEKLRRILLSAGYSP